MADVLNATTKRQVPLGVYVVGGLVVISLADTRAAPVIVAFLAAAAIYNANYLLNRSSLPTTPGAQGQSGFAPGSGAAGGGSGGGGGGSW